MMTESRDLLKRLWQEPCWAAGPLCLTLGLAWQGAAMASETAAIRITEVLVDGQRAITNLAPNARAGNGRLRPGAHTLEFQYGPVAEAADQPLRLRYQLEGYDTRWREAGGEMRVSALVLNAASEVLAFHDFPMRGESEGWRGSLAESQFSQRREQILLPPGAERLRVQLISGGWMPVLGLAAVAELKVSITNAQGQLKNHWPNSGLTEGEDLGKPEGSPRGWSRGGFGSSMARLAELPGGRRGLAVQDDNVRSYCEWRSDLPFAGWARAGDTVVLEWKEAFTIGTGGVQSMNYAQLPPGDYVFRVGAVSPTELPTGVTDKLAFSIAQVFWKRGWFILLVTLTAASSLAVGVRLITRRRMKQELARLEQQRALERERARIAQDINDDLGASLTRIAMLSQSVRRGPDGALAAAAQLGQISSTARDMVRAMDEIVWAVDPTQDSWDSVASYCGRFAQEFLSESRLRCRLDLPVQLPPHPLPAEVRHNLFLAFKEALNNAVRHAEAHEVRIALEVKPSGLTLSVEDDGRGFALGAEHCNASSRGSRGLVGMKERLAKIGGRLELESSLGKGTRVRFVVPLQETKL